MSVITEDLTTTTQPALEFDATADKLSVWQAVAGRILQHFESPEISKSPVARPEGYINGILSPRQDSATYVGSLLLAMHSRGYQIASTDDAANKGKARGLLANVINTDIAPNPKLLTALASGEWSTFGKEFLHEQWAVIMESSEVSVLWLPVAVEPPQDVSYSAAGLPKHDMVLHAVRRSMH